VIYLADVEIKEKDEITRTFYIKKIQDKLINEEKLKTGKYKKTILQEAINEYFKTRV